MTTSNQPKIRAVSARLVSGGALMPNIQNKNKKNIQKAEFFQQPNLVGNSNHTGYQKNKLFMIKSNIKQDQFDDLIKILPKEEKISKEKQQLFQQNLHLKKQLNHLKQQLQRSRTKIESLIQKNKKYTAKFNRQFQKKIYWNTQSNDKNIYLISGIKAQYQRIKQQCQQKQLDYQLLKKQYIQSKVPEYKIYAENLQNQNKKLVQEIHRLTSQFKDSSLNEKLFDLEEMRNLERKNQKLTNQLQEVQQQLRQNKQQNEQYQQKIQFLQKSLISKNTNQYQTQKKYKKLQRQKNLIDNNIKELSKQNEEIIKNYELKLQKLKLMQQKKFKIEKDTFNKTLSQKDIQNQKLKKQVAYLSTLLTYWKPLDQLKDYNIQQEPQEQNKKQNGSTKKQQLDFLNSNHSRRISKQLEQSQKGIEYSLKQSIELSQQLKDGNKQEKSRTNRIQQTADERHSQYAEKKRKVQYKEVQHIGENLRYRFLGLRLQINDVRKYFDFPKQLTNPQNFYAMTDSFKEEQQKEKPWEEEYISMSEVQQIVKNYPFELLEEQSTLLARYMIQDSMKDYVYVDAKNEQKRSIVKSIIKTLVGNYVILDGQKQEQVEKQCKSMLQKYQTNLFSVLSQTASAGYVSRKKFIELLNSLGIEISEEGKDFLVCKMLLKSKSLNQLEYMSIF